MEKKSCLYSLLRLSLTPGIGPKTIQKILHTYGDLPYLIKQWHEYFPKKTLASEESVDKQLRACEKQGVFLLSIQDPSYPNLLKQIEDPPPILYWKGNFELLASIKVAVVGSRNASYAGQSFTKFIVQNLGTQNISIVSGLARGIDAAAHTYSLETGTIAVLPGGIDIVYPPHHAALYKKIEQTGILLSERPLGLSPHSTDFPRRNRLIAGLAQCICVIEAAKNSGSLITAQYGLEQGKEIFAVPGHPFEPRAKGTNYLLKDGATMLDSPWPLLESLKRFLPKETTKSLTISSNSSTNTVGTKCWQEDIIGLLGTQPVAIHEIAQHLTLSIPKVRQELVILELQGKIKFCPGDRICIKT